MEVTLWSSFCLPLPLCIPSTSIINCLSQTLIAGLISSILFLTLQFSSHLPPISPPPLWSRCPPPPCLPTLGPWTRHLCQRLHSCHLLYHGAFITGHIAGEMTASAWSGFRVSLAISPDLAAPMWCDFSHQVLFSFSLPVFAWNTMNLI